MLYEVITDTQRGAIGGRGRERTREVLVVTQVALSEKQRKKNC